MVFFYVTFMSLPCLCDHLCSRLPYSPETCRFTGKGKLTNGKNASLGTDDWSNDWTDLKYVRHWMWLQPKHCQMTLWPCWPLIKADEATLPCKHMDFCQSLWPLTFKACINQLLMTKSIEVKEPCYLIIYTFPWLIPLFCCDVPLSLWGPAKLMNVYGHGNISADQRSVMMTELSQKLNQNEWLITLLHCKSFSLSSLLCVLLVWSSSQNVTFPQLMGSSN